MANDTARQGEHRAAGAVLATTYKRQADDRAAAGAEPQTAAGAEPRAAEQVEVGFDGAF